MERHKKNGRRNVKVGFGATQSMRRAKAQPLSYHADGECATQRHGGFNRPAVSVFQVSTSITFWNFK